ncbi:MAG: leucyl aminopeptidase [Micromonosporaceae bacterium]
MTTVAVTDTNPTDLAVDAIVVGLHQTDGNGALRLAEGAQSVDAAFRGELVDTFKLLGATGAVGEVTKLASLGAIQAPVVAAVGLGALDKLDDEALRRAAGSAVRALAGCEQIALVVRAPDGATTLAEGSLLGAYQFAGYKSRPEPTHKDPVGQVQLLVDSADTAVANQVATRAEHVSRAVSQVRDWANTPANQLRPPEFADQVAAAARDAQLEAEVLDETALREAGYGGILAVGGGSGAPPRLVRLAYRGPAANGGQAAKHVALVGKGITFDSGGVSIKPSQGMWDMKMDMAGAAAVAGTMLAVAALRPAVSVTAYLPMAENMLSGEAYRPGDVVTMYNGKRVEVLNTDAEGRMVLGDAIARACEDEPDYLLETSTLTGGQVTALGRRVCGVMGADELCERVRQIGERVGERCWPMPLPDDIRKGMESDIADITQVATGMDRAGHMLQGAVFLSQFVTDDLPWAHIDCAGPAMSPEAYGYIVKGATGVPLRTMLAVIEDIAANG